MPSHMMPPAATGHFAPGDCGCSNTASALTWKWTITMLPSHVNLAIGRDRPRHTWVRTVERQANITPQGTELKTGLTAVGSSRQQCPRPRTATDSIVAKVEQFEQLFTHSHQCASPALSTSHMAVLAVSGQHKLIETTPYVITSRVLSSYLTTHSTVRKKTHLSRAQT